MLYIEAGGEAGPERACRKTVHMTGSNPSPADSKYLTVAEVATMMRVSKMTVYRLVHSGDLPAIRVGRSFRVAESDVDEYLRNSYFSAG